MTVHDHNNLKLYIKLINLLGYERWQSQWRESGRWLGGERSDGPGSGAMRAGLAARTKRPAAGASADH